MYSHLTTASTPQVDASVVRYHVADDPPSQEARGAAAGTLKTSTHTAVMQRDAEAGVSTSRAAAVSDWGVARSRRGTGDGAEQSPMSQLLVALHAWLLYKPRLLIVCILGVLSTCAAAAALLTPWFRVQASIGSIDGIGVVYLSSVTWCSYLPTGLGSSTCRSTDVLINAPASLANVATMCAITFTFTFVSIGPSVIGASSTYLQRKHGGASTAPADNRLAQIAVGAFCVTAALQLIGVAVFIPLMMLRVTPPGLARACGFDPGDAPMSTSSIIHVGLVFLILCAILNVMIARMVHVFQFEVAQKVDAESRPADPVA